MNINKNVILGASLLYIMSSGTVVLAEEANYNNKISNVAVSHEITPTWKHVLIELKTKGINNTKIKSITLPNGKVTKNPNVTFKAKDSGVYDFVIEDTKGKKTTYSVKIDISNDGFFKRVFANFNSKIKPIEKEYIIKKGDILNLKLENDNNINTGSIVLNLNGVDEIPVSCNENELTFFLNHINEGEYKALLKSFDPSTGQEILGSSFDLVILEADAQVQKNTKSLNQNTDITVSKDIYNIEPGSFLTIEYNKKNGITVDYPRLNINGQDIFSNYYSDGSGTFYLNNLSEGVYKARLKGLTFSGNEYISNEFTIKIGNSNTERPSNPPNNKPDTGNNTPEQVEPINPPSSNKEDLTVSKETYTINPGSSLTIEYKKKDGITVDYPRLNINGQDIFANYYSEGSGTFYLNNLSEGVYKAKLKGLTFSGNEYISNEFTIKIGNSNTEIPVNPPTNQPENKPDSKPNTGNNNPEEVKPVNPPSSNKEDLTVSKETYTINPGSSLTIEYKKKDGITVDYPRLNINGQDIFANYYSEGSGTFYLNNLSEGVYKAKLKGLTFSGNEYISNEFNIKIGNSNTEIPSNPPINEVKPPTNVVTSRIEVYGDKFFVKKGDSLYLSYSTTPYQNIHNLALNINGVGVKPKYNTEYYAEFNFDSNISGQHMAYLTAIDSNGNTIKSNYFIVEIENKGSDTSVNKPTSSYTPKDSMSATAHEGIPNGAPTDWKYKPRIENQNRPNNWNAVGQWGQVYLEEGFSYPENTAIEIANFKMYGYSEQLKEWKLINHSIPGDVFYVEDFNGDTNKAFPNKIKKDYENKSLIVKLDKDTKGFNLHPFSQQIDTKSVGLPDVKYVISQMDVRLVKWDENGIDDMDKARYVANVGGDWWRNVGDVWKPDWSTNVGIAQGQFRTISKEWKSCYMTTVPLDKYDEIVK